MYYYQYYYYYHYYYYCYYYIIIIIIINIIIIIIILFFLIDLNPQCLHPESSVITTHRRLGGSQEFDGHCQSLRTKRTFHQC